MAKKKKPADEPMPQDPARPPARMSFAPPAVDPMMRAPAPPPPAPALDVDALSDAEIEDLLCDPRFDPYGDERVRLAQALRRRGEARRAAAGQG